MHDPTTCDRCYEFDIWVNRSASPSLRGFLSQLKAEHVERGVNEATVTFVMRAVDNVTPSISSSPGLRISGAKVRIQ